LMIELLRPPEIATEVRRTATLARRDRRAA
jgi:hypothetical protein